MDTARTNEIEKRKRTQHYEVLREMGDCYTSVGDYSQAQRCYEKAASLGPDEPGPYVGLGVAALQKEELDEAEIAFRVACRLDANCAKAYAGAAATGSSAGFRSLHEVAGIGYGQHLGSSRFVPGLLRDGFVCQGHLLS